jgi:beta-phosphoglucomutase-like phosphatase (HAD superfamily)
MFEFTIAGDEVTKKKPDPEMFLKTLKHFQISKEDTIVFEDSTTGAHAAVDAGLKPMIVSVDVISEMAYPEGIRGFASNFEELNLSVDEQLLEMVKNEVENLTKNQNVQTPEQTPTPQNPNLSQ